MLYIPGLASLAAKTRFLLIVSALAAPVVGCRSCTRPDVNDGGIACQHTCTPDPGPRLVECAKAQAGFEFAPYIWNFEESSPINAARAMYSYTDNTQSIATFFGSDGGRKTYQPPTAVMPRCSDAPNPMNRTIHVQGGPFLAWGGGIGIAMKDHPYRGNFPASPGPTGPAAAFPGCSCVPGGG